MSTLGELYWEPLNSQLPERGANLFMFRTPASYKHKNKVVCVGRLEHPKNNRKPRGRHRNKVEYEWKFHVGYGAYGPTRLLEGCDSLSVAKSVVEMMVKIEGVKCIN